MRSQVNVNRAYTTNGLNQHTASGSVSLGYDARGNLTSSGSDAFAYDSENRLLSKTSGSTTNSVGYDPLGRMNSYTLPSPTVGFVSDGGNLAAAYVGTTMSRRYVLGAGTDEVLAENPESSTNIRYLATDERGTIIAASNASGTVTGKDTYDEYGIPGSGNNTYSAHAYTGQVYLQELGLYYYKARFYSPTLGRFLQTDPIGYGDGMNWYNYTGSDPVNATDPTGTIYVITTVTCVPIHLPTVSGEQGDIVVNGPTPYSCTTQYMSYPELSFGRDNAFGAGSGGGTIAQQSAPPPCPHRDITGICDSYGYPTGTPKVLHKERCERIAMFRDPVGHVTNRNAAAVGAGAIGVGTIIKGVAGRAFGVVGWVLSGIQLIGGISGLVVGCD